MLAGPLFGFLAHSAEGGGLDFSPIAGITAERYDLQVDQEAGHEAKRLLDGLSREPVASATRR